MKSLARWSGRLTLGACVVFIATAATAHSLQKLEDQLTAKEPYIQVVNQPAPAFTLQDADGRAVSLDDFHDKVVVLYFIYARRPDVCPLQSEKLAGIQKMINSTPMRDLVEFVAITTDPEHDTPDMLKAYGPAHGLDPTNWVFLTSGADAKATRELAAAYGLLLTPEAGGSQMHGVVTHVIDKSGNLRARFHSLKFDDLSLIIYVNALTNDYH